jgi:Mrp family chromosome partitioning ATPase
VRLCIGMSLLNKACVARNEHWMVPQPVNSLFTGRSELIAQIQSAIRTDDLDMTEQKRLVITGMGGMGKSEVCLRIANEMRQE